MQKAIKSHRLLFADEVVDVLRISRRGHTCLGILQPQKKKEESKEEKGQSP